MRKIIIAVLCSICCTNLINAQDSAEDFRNGLEEIYASMRSKTDIFEQHMAEQGVQLKMDVYYSRATDQIIFSYEFFSEEMYNAGDLDKGARQSIFEMARGFNQSDPSGETLKWFTDGIRKTNTSLVYIVKYKSLQKKKIVTNPEFVKLLVFHSVLDS